MSSVPQSTAADGAYAACLQAAVESGSSVAHRIVAQAFLSIPQRAAVAPSEEERKWQEEAAQFLSLHEHTFCEAYPQALRQEFAAPQEDDAPKAAALSFESLELMAEEQVDETVEVLRAQQTVLSEVETELAQLNALVSAARGQKTVSASANPLHPQAWVRALRNATRECSVPAAVRVRWLHHLSEALGPQLAPVYRDLCSLLRSHGVTAAGFRINMAPERRGAAVPAVAAPAETVRSAPVAPAAPGTPPLLNLRDLRRLLTADRQKLRESASQKDTVQSDGDTLLAEGGEGADTGLTVPFAFEALQEMKQVKVDQLLQRMQRRRASEAADHAGQREDAQARSPLTPARALSHEVVKLMVENIAADARLLSPVQQAVRSLEPALLRLARNDPRFFGDKQHPARQFLTELTQRSLAWPKPDMPGFAAFFEPLRQAVEALTDLPMDDAEPFEFALHSLRQAWGEHEERVRRDRAKLAQAMIRAEKRNLLAARIAEDMRGRPDMAAAPGEVRRFLTGPWSQVIAAARLADASGAADPGAYAGIINDLIWTSQPRLAGANPARLAKLAPPLLATLRRGLASIEFPREEAQRFLDYLADKHQMALRPPGAAGAVTASVPAPAFADRSDSQFPPEHGQPQVWLEPAEARESRLMQLPQTTADWRLETRSLDAPEARRGSVVPPIAAVANLLPGVWVDLFLNGAWSRWQLTWATPHSLLFMFTDAAGKSQSITRSMLENLVAFKALHVVSQQTVVDGALDAVAHRALRNSMDTSF